MNSHKRRRRRLLHVQPVETIRPFRPGPPSRHARLAELNFFRMGRRQAILDPEPVGGWPLPRGKGKERRCIDGVWGPWIPFSYDLSEPPQGALP